MVDELSENLGQAIRLTQKLRTTVSKVFEDLHSGLHDSQDNKDVALNNFQKSLLAVNTDISALEKVSGQVRSNQVTPVINSSQLSLDPGADKSPLYSQLLHAYKWSNKTFDCASVAVGILNQNSLRRTSIPRGLSKRLQRPTSTSHAVSPQKLDTFVQNWGRLFPDMTVSLHRPLGNSAVLLIHLGKVMQVLVVLRGLILEWVKVKGHKETFFNEDHKMDVWSQSHYHVFQKVTDHAVTAMPHFYYPLIPELAVKSFLTWLHSYVNLFTVPCHKCGHILLDGLPPTWRDLKTCDAYHDSCRQ